MAHPLDDPDRWRRRFSPGDGITMPKLSREPLATEGEATPGPDDVNPFDEIETREDMRAIRRSRPPEGGIDESSYLFDDIEPSLPGF